MAQTKTKKKSQTKKRAASTSSNGGRATKSRAKSAARKTSAKKTPARKSTRSAASRSNSSSKSNSSSSRNSGGTGFAEKAKKPALATGVVLLGLAGGAAATARKAQRRGPKLPKPNLKRLPRPKSVSLPKSHGSTAAWVGEKARALGDAGHRVSDMSSQAEKVEKTLRKR